MPPKTDDIEVRIIRNRFGTETKQSLSNKIASIKREFETIKGQDWINTILINDNKEKFLARAGVHVVFKMYELR